MASYWEYFQEGLFKGQVREIKKVRKAKTLADYEGYAADVISAL